MEILDEMHHEASGMPRFDEHPVGFILRLVTFRPNRTAKLVRNRKNAHTHLGGWGRVVG